MRALNLKSIALVLAGSAVALAVPVHAQEGAPTPPPGTPSDEEPAHQSHRGSLKVKIVLRVPPPSPELVARGKTLFGARCARCHAADGSGTGPEAARLDPRPRDLRHNHFKLRSTEAGSLPTDKDLERTILKGIPGTAMVGTPLAAAQVKDVIAYIKSMRLPHLHSRFRKDPPGQVLEVPKAPKLTWARAARGRQLFRVFRCWRCHGTEGRGDGISSKRLRDRVGYHTLPADLHVRPFKSGDRPEDIFRLIITGMDYTPMPSWPVDRIGIIPGYDNSEYEGLTPQQITEMREYVKSQPAVDLGPKGLAERAKLGTERIWDLVAFIYSVRHLESARLAGPRPRNLPAPTPTPTPVPPRR